MGVRAGAILLLIAVVATLLFSGCGDRDAYVGRRIREAREHAQRRDYDRAHAVLDAALERAPTEVELALEKAAIFMRARRHGDAASWYREAEKIDGTAIGATTGRWEAEHAIDRDDGAVRERILLEADERLAAAPDSVANLTAAVTAYRMLGEEDCWYDADN